MRLTTRLPLALTLALAATTAARAEGDLPFLGKWDCDIAVLTFTADTYHDGTNSYPLTDMVQDGGAYVITLTPDYVIGLDGIEADKMSFAPMAGGDQFSCFRLE